MRLLLQLLALQGSNCVCPSSIDFVFLHLIFFQNFGVGPVVVCSVYKFFSLPVDTDDCLTERWETGLMQKGVG